MNKDVKFLVAVNNDYIFNKIKEMGKKMYLNMIFYQKKM